MKSEIGIIGLAVMGANLARNIAGHEIKTLVFNRTYAKTVKFMEDFGTEYLDSAETMEEFVSKLEKPRRVLLMIKSGAPVDGMLEKLLPLLEKGDIVIDGGNSFYKDTIRRTKELESKGIHFVGMGISGGEEGALHGPSLMPGGSDESYHYLEPILKAMASMAQGEPCVTHIGTDGAGHYVKMVHNGIEYADMQLICDIYSIMKNVLHMDHKEMKEVWEKWNKGRLSSYLVEITATIMGKMDEKTGKPLLECILDEAGQKGTGKWTGMSALDLGVPAPTIAEAVFARALSAERGLRLKAAEVYPAEPVISTVGKEKILADLEGALYASKICAYAQGFQIMSVAAKEYNWQLDFSKISKIWRNGCIIRAIFLDKVSEIYSEDKDLENLLLAPYFSQALKEAYPGWVRVTCLALQLGIAIPCLSSALTWFDNLRTPYTSANLIQALRDYFGAHTYKRLDNPEEAVHTEWIHG